MNLEIENGTIITFHTQRVGKKDLVRDGGTHRGRHTVKVTMLVGTDYKTVAGIDFYKMYEKEPKDYAEAIKERTGLEFSDLDLRCAWYSRSLYDGLYESSRGENNLGKHLNAYEPHPCGIRGVMVHKENGGVYLSGVLVSEEIIERDPNGDVNKREDTLERKLIKAVQKELGLISGKWRSYKLPAGVTINGLDKEV